MCCRVKVRCWSNGVLEPVRTDFQLRDPRVHLNAEAFLSGSQRGEIVMVRNISAGGLGFDGAVNVSAGQAIEIRLVLSGRRLTGRVAWKIGEKAGVEFTERLAAGRYAADQLRRVASEDGVVAAIDGCLAL